MEFELAMIVYVFEELINYYIQILTWIYKI